MALFSSEQLLKNKDNMYEPNFVSSEACKELTGERLNSPVPYLQPF